MAPLTPEERHEMLKMGEKPLMFVEKAHDFARQNPTLVPAHLDMDAFDVDFEDAHGLWTLLNTIQQLEEGVDDTEMIAGSEAYQSALVFYKSVKMAAARRPSGRNSRPASPADGGRAAKRRRKPKAKPSKRSCRIL
jgi:hypothetical protein